ncbi:hypothetical protein [Aquibacillus salsiterrae]|nr:hypothetical protein [Aquibacillus salsiterrae]
MAIKLGFPQCDISGDEDKGLSIHQTPANKNNVDVDKSDKKEETN